MSVVRLYSLQKVTNFDDLRKLAITNTRPRRVTYKQNFTENYLKPSGKADFCPSQEYHEITILLDGFQIIKARRYSNKLETWSLRRDRKINNISNRDYMHLFTPFTYVYFAYSYTYFLWTHQNDRQETLIKMPHDKWLVIKSTIGNDLNQLISTETHIE